MKIDPVGAVERAPPPWASGVTERPVIRSDAPHQQKMGPRTIDRTIDHPGQMHVTQDFRPDAKLRAIDVAGGRGLRLCKRRSHDSSSQRPYHAPMTESRTEDALVGSVLAGRFHIERLLGAGAMGKIYRARQIEMDRAVALKVIHPELWGDAEVIGRFERELKVTTRIEHPNTVRVYEHGRTAEGQPYLVMELLDGRLLASLIADEAPLAPARIAHIGMQMAHALAAAHAVGVVHRDLKPENVILLDLHGQKDFVKLLDFGLSRVKREAEGAKPQHLTLEGVRVGTPLYMAPEYVAAFSSDHRADLYALGAILFEMCTGKPIYHGRPYEILEQQVHGDVPRPSSRRPETPEWLDELVVRLLAKDPEQRLQHATDVARVFERAWANLVSEPHLDVTDLLEAVTPPPMPALPRPDPGPAPWEKIGCIAGVVAGGLLVALAAAGLLGAALIGL